VNNLSGLSGNQRSANRWGAIVLALILIVVFGTANSAKAAPDLVIIHGSVLTMEPNQPRAAAIAVEGGVITHVGSTGSIRALIGPKTQVIDAAGRTIVPGFIDSHMHPRAQFDELGPYGRLDLTPEAGVSTRADLYAKLRAKIAVTPPGQLIVGSRYQDDLIGGHPTAAELDAIAPNHPVILVHSSGHRRSVNSLALKGAGITDATPNPAGGAIDTVAPTALRVLRPSAETDPLVFRINVTSDPATGSVVMTGVSTHGMSSRTNSASPSPRGPDAR
jgi:hypothetical protein